MHALSREEIQKQKRCKEGAERKKTKMGKTGDRGMKGNRDPRPSAGLGRARRRARAGVAGRRQVPNRLSGGRGRARLACSYRQAGASARLPSSSRCSLLQLCSSKFASTLNCQVSRSREARELGPRETPDPALTFPSPTRVENIPVWPTHRELIRLRSARHNRGGLPRRGSLTRPQNPGGKGRIPRPISQMRKLRNRKRDLPYAESGG